MIDLSLARRVLNKAGKELSKTLADTVISPDAAVLIQKALDDDDWGVRLAGIYSLGDLASEESIAMIKKARRKEKDKDFKKACNKAIKKAEKAMKNK